MISYGSPVVNKRAMAALGMGDVELTIAINSSVTFLYNDALKFPNKISKNSISTPLT